MASPCAAELRVSVPRQASGGRRERAMRRRAGRGKLVNLSAARRDTAERPGVTVLGDGRRAPWLAVFAAGAAMAFGGVCRDARAAQVKREATAASVEAPAKRSERVEVPAEVCTVASSVVTFSTVVCLVAFAVWRQGTRLDEHGRMLQDHGRMLEEHGRMLDEHGRMLQDHGRMLQEILERLDKLDSKFP